ncbi:unnamed protein product [Cercopithifilaria johnstoni]|uniref:Uncharacterized protein n=1 Tax=Cercopithifilaria johnstoni TaxID=2874296 RepID=A0A8J2Q475_9BILA|nr:unnamed protein product [Cercopithifilaria johnstoni]
MSLWETNKPAILRGAISPLSHFTWLRVMPFQSLKAWFFHFFPYLAIFVVYVDLHFLTPTTRRKQGSSHHILPQELSCDLSLQNCHVISRRNLCLFYVLRHLRSAHYRFVLVASSYVALSIYYILHPRLYNRQVKRQSSVVDRNNPVRAGSQTGCIVDSHRLEQEGKLGSHPQLVHRRMCACAFFVIRGYMETHRRMNASHNDDIANHQQDELIWMSDMVTC